MKKMTKKDLEFVLNNLNYNVHFTSCKICGMIIMDDKTYLGLCKHVLQHKKGKKNVNRKQ